MKSNKETSMDLLADNYVNWKAIVEELFAY